MGTDTETLAVYAAQAQAYADRFGKDEPSESLTALIAALPPGACVLDLGCGPGQASRFMADAGLRPDPVDASPEMVALAQAQGLPARLGTFDDLDATAAYDAVWANFSLLHAPRAVFPRHLAAIARALKPGGLFHLGLKTGTGERRDRLGRFYAYFSEAELEVALAQAGFTILTRRTFAESGLAGPVEPGIIILSRKSNA